MPSTVGYWKIRALAQPIRLMLGYAGEEFEDVVYEMTDGPEFSPKEWTKHKFNLGLAFPNVPYYECGDLKMTQSGAIMRHLAKKHHLEGNTELEHARCEMAGEQLMEFRNAWIQICYGKALGFKDTKETGPVYAANLKTAWAPFEAFLGERNWLAGRILTWADFLLWELLDEHLIFKPDCLDELPRLKSFHRRFAETPNIKRFMASKKYFRGPICNKFASWGGKHPEQPFKC